MHIYLESILVLQSQIYFLTSEIYLVSSIRFSIDLEATFEESSNVTYSTVRLIFNLGSLAQTNETLKLTLLLGTLKNIEIPWGLGKFKRLSTWKSLSTVKPTVYGRERTASHRTWTWAYRAVKEVLKLLKKTLTGDLNSVKEWFWWKWLVYLIQVVFIIIYSKWGLLFSDKKSSMLSIGTVLIGPYS